MARGDLSSDVGSGSVLQFDGSFAKAADFRECVPP